MPEIEIRLMTPDEAEIYRAVRLEALQDSPQAYGSSFEDECAQPLSWFTERLSSSKVFGAFAEGVLVAIAGFRMQSWVKQAHKGYLWGVYVRPDFRRLGLARKLAETILKYAEDKVELVQLGVESGNEGALRLYTQLGFTEYGREKNSIKYRGRYYDELMMVLEFKAGASAGRG